MTTHIVKQGECLSRIAAANGFSDWREVYNHGDNAGLRKKRPNPHVLFPGDEVVIPPIEDVEVKTGAMHTFVLKTPKRKLKVCMLDEHRSPMKDERYTAECGDHMYYGKTDGDGMLELELPIAGDELLIWIAGQARTLLLGQLNPIDDAPDEGVSGVQGRLVGLGFDAGAADGKLGPKTAAALIAFQRHYGLKLSGEADPNTIAKLKKEYRS